MSKFSRLQSAAVVIATVIVFAFAQNVLAQSGSKGSSKGASTPGSPTLGEPSSNSSQQQGSQSKGNSQPGLPSAQTALRPYLSISGISLRDNKIQISIKNKGPGKLSSKDYEKGKLVLKLNKLAATATIRPTNWSLKTIDPTKRLNNVNQSISFDTRLVVTESQLVTAGFKNVPGDKAKAQELTPTRPAIGSLPDREDKDASHQGPGFTSRRLTPEGAAAAEAAADKAARAEAGRAGLRSSCIFDAYMNSRGDTFKWGAELNIGWSHGPAVEPSTPFSVRLVSRERGRFSHEITSEYPGAPNLRWTIPARIPDGEYSVYIGIGAPTNPDSLHRCTGHSESFTIVDDIPVGSNGAMRITAPVPPRSFLPIGSTTDISWESECCPGSASITLRKRWDRDFLHVITPRFDDHCSATYPWPIPDTLSPGDNYYLVVKSGSCWATSSPFSMDVVGDAGGDGIGRRPPPPTPPVEISEPDDGHIFMLAAPVQVQWSAPECEAFKVIFLKGGVEELSLPLTSYCGGRSKSYMLMNANEHFVSGTDYQIRVEYYEFVSNPAGGDDIPTLRGDDTTGYLTFLNNWMPPTGGACNARQTVFLHMPNGREGERFSIGDPLEVQWCHFPAREGHVRLSLVRDSLHGGGSWSIRGRVSADDFSHTWRIPTSIPPGEGYRVQVEDLDGTGVYVSMYPFTIDPEE